METKLAKKTVKVLPFNQAIPPMQSREQLKRLALPIGKSLVRQACDEGYVPISDLFFDKVDDCEMEVQIHCIHVGTVIAKSYEQILDLTEQYRVLQFRECMWKEFDDGRTELA